MAPWRFNAVANYVALAARDKGQAVTGVAFTDTLPAAKLRLAWHRGAWELAAGVGHAPRVPEANERYLALKRMGTDWVGNPDLAPSRNTAVDLAAGFTRAGFRVDLGLFAGELDVDLLAEALGIQRPAFGVGSEVFVLPERRQLRQFLRNRDLHMMARNTLVIGSSLAICQAAFLEVAGIDHYVGRSRPVWRALHVVCGGFFFAEFTIGPMWAIPMDIAPRYSGFASAVAESGQVCIQVFFLRAGQNLGNRAYFPAHTRDLDTPAVLSAFIGQFYEARTAPRLILTSHDASERELLESALGKKAVIDRQPPQPGDVPITFADISKARAKLGYDPRVKIERGIPLFVKWLLSRAASE